ncbi:MAG TPA: VanW family protein [Polyangiaceae bacterium]|nr:VanW family protein [Polyangiaceae bacterium]
MPPAPPPAPPVVRRRRLALAGTALIWAGLSIGAGAALAHAIERRAAPAAEVAGHVVPPGRPLEPWVEELAGRLEARPVNLSLPEGAEELTLGELGVEVDAAATAKRVREAGELGVLARLGSLFGRPAARPEVSPVWRVDETRARAKLEAIKARVDRDPVNARVDLVQHERLDEVPGRELDVAETLARLAALPPEAGEVLVPALRERPAAVTAAMLGSVDVRKVLAYYETSFSRRGKVAGRAVNIAVAAAKLDGRVLGPGETVSFNRVVGPRTEEAGFAHAPEIFEDEMKDGVGGGTCQVASTLHAAAVYGGLEMVERRSHSRPSGYAPLGLDATVVDGAVDLKIKNPHPFPLLIHAYLPRPTVLRVELLGADPPSHVEYRYAASGKGEDFVRRLTFKPEMAQGEFVRKQKGHRGQNIVSRVTFRWPDGRVVERSYKSEYHAVPEVLWVGPGVDEASLPEVPAGAIGVERRGLPEPPNGAAGAPAAG